MAAEFRRPGDTLARHPLEAGDEVGRRRIVVTDLGLDDVTKPVRAHDGGEIDDGTSRPGDQQPIQHHHVGGIG